MSDIKQLAKAAYDAYCDTRNWLSYNGEPLPQWDEVEDSIKEGWIEAVIAIYNSTRLN